MHYTVELYRQDGRCKGGEKYLKSIEIENATRKEIEALFDRSDYDRYEVHETYVTRKNIMTGKDFQEHYKTPHYCSPSSESYFSM